MGSQYPFRSSRLRTAMEIGFSLGGLCGGCHQHWIRLLFAPPVQFLPASLCPHNLDSQGEFLDTTEPKHSGTGHRGTQRCGNPDTPERNPGKPETGEPGHPGTGHCGNDPFRNPDMVSRGPASELGALSRSGSAASPGSTSSGAAMSARSEGTSLAARWRDTGDTRCASPA